MRYGKGEKLLTWAICIFAVIVLAGAVILLLPMLDGGEEEMQAAEETMQPAAADTQAPEEEFYPDQEVPEDTHYVLLSALHAYRAVLADIYDSGRDPWVREAPMERVDRVYAELVDFDSDGVPELLLVIKPEMQVAGGICSLYILRYTGQAELIYRGNMWASAGMGYYALEDAANGEVYLVHIESMDFDMPFEIIHFLLREAGFEWMRQTAEHSWDAMLQSTAGTRSLWMWDLPSNLREAIVEIDRQIAELGG